jgi:hypothetical protein
MLADQRDWLLVDDRADKVVTALFVFRLVLITAVSFALWSEYKILTILLIILTCVAIFTHYRKPSWLPACHVFASALWGGFASVLVVNQEYGLTVCFVLMIVFETAVGTMRLREVPQK